MSRCIPSLIGFLVCAALAGCGTQDMVAMSETGSERLPFQSTQSQEQALEEQAVALDQITRDLVRRATVQGAGLGAAAGCGLAVVAGSASKQCLTGALAGGAMGAIAGNTIGKQQVNQRVELVSLSKVTPTIAQAKEQLRQVETSLPTLLQAQSEDVLFLEARRLEGDISQADFEARIAEIKATRATLAQALTLSAEQAKQAHSALSAAQAQGQSGMDWHLMTISQLEQDALSARAQISLL